MQPAVVEMAKRMKREGAPTEVIERDDRPVPSGVPTTITHLKFKSPHAQNMQVITIFPAHALVNTSTFTDKISKFISHALALAFVFFVSACGFGGAAGLLSTTGGGGGSAAFTSTAGASGALSTTGGLTSGGLTSGPFSGLCSDLCLASLVREVRLGASPSCRVGSTCVAVSGLVSCGFSEEAGGAMTDCLMS